jgi:5-formyltetrahydrofolate cyclo-ligase
MKISVPEITGIQHQKKHLRSDMRKQRRMLDDQQRTQANRAISRGVIERLALLQPCIVAAYLAFDGEPDLGSAFPELIEAGFRLALPFIESHGDASHMVFRYWQPEDSLARNRMGFFEPHLGATVATKELGAILMPLVAWDAKGSRLGMGAGYYDRALEPLRNSATPLRIGIAFDVQRTDAIPTDPHDVPLHELISDSQRFTFTS